MIFWIKNISSLTFLLSAILLVLWMFQSVRGKKSGFWGIFFGLSLIAHLGITYVTSSLMGLLPKAALDFFLLGIVGISSMILRPLLGHTVRYGAALLATIAMVSLIRLWSPSRSVLKSTVPEFLVEIPDAKLVEFKKIYKPYIRSMQKAFVGKRLSDTELDEVYLLDVKDSKLAQFRAVMPELSGADWIEDNETIQVDVRGVPRSETVDTETARPMYTNDPMVDDQWALRYINAESFVQAMGRKKIKKKAKLFILDTGIDLDHEDLKGNVAEVTGEKPTDKVGHGTHCAGIAAAVTNNARGVASPLVHSGVYNVCGIQVLNDFGAGTQAKIIQGIIKATDEGADVISMSLGGISNDKRQRIYNEAIKYANDGGAIVLAAAGNAGQDARRHAPANAKNVICVGALDPAGAEASFSNDVSGIELSVMAPGVQILSTYPDDRYQSFNGTSMATPLVASLVATLKAIRPELSTREIHALIRNNDVNAQSNKLDFGSIIDGLD